jgi:serine/threonine protein kinase
MMQVLGTGNFASVVLGINKETGERVAIKVIDKKKFAMSNGTKRQNALMGEVEILQTLKHPGVRFTLFTAAFNAALQNANVSSFPVVHHHP